MKVQGEFFRPEKTRYQETIIFVPFFGAHKKQMRRHREFILSLGFECFIIEHSFHPHRPLRKIPISRDRRWGLKHLWADEIEATLNSIEGSKIVFAFSNPASCAIEAIARRTPLDVRALVCDSGPFYYFNYCNSNRLLYEEKIVNPVRRLVVNSFQQLGWSANHEATLKQSLEMLPQDYPVLSIRGGQDRIVPPWAIDAAFREQKHLALDVLNLPDADHLKGLRDFPDPYRTKVSAFLLANAKLI